MKKLLLILTVLCMAVFFSACNEPSNPAPTRVAVTLDLNGGEIEGGVSHTAVIGENLTLNTPTKYGYEFIGWSHEGEIVSLSPFNISKYAVTLKAEWLTAECQVTLNLAGGYLESGQGLTYGARYGEIAQIPTPKKTGYDFGGWLYNSGIIEFTPFNVQNVFSMTVNAKWIAKTYTVNLNFNGGTAKVDGEDYTSYAVLQIFGKGIDFPIPSKNGYEFQGYEINGELIQGSIWDIDVENPTLTAVYSPINVRYNLISDGDSLAFDGGVIKYGASTQTIKDIIPLKKGYEFLGWQVNGEFLGETFNYLPTNSSSVNVVAVFNPKTYTVTLNAGEGSITTENQISMTFGKAYQCPIPIAPIGKKFLGYKISSGEMVTAPSGNVIYNLDYNAEFIAVYSEIEYLIFIHVDGSIEKVEIVGEGELLEEDVPTPKQLPGKKVRWELSYDEVLLLTETTEIKAVVDSVYSYVAVYKTANKEIFETYKYGDTITLPTAERDDVSQKGHTFLGWSFSSTDKENYVSGELKWTFTSNKTFYAVYIPNTYKVTYDFSNLAVEGVLYNGETVAPSYQTIVYGSQYSLYTLNVADDIVTVGWTYNGELVQNSGKWIIASDVTLVAEVVSYKNVNISVNVDVNGGSGDSYATVILGKELSLLSVAPTPPNGYELTGYKYKDKTYLLSDVWNVIDYDGEPLIAQYRQLPKTITVNIDLNGGIGSAKAQICVGEKLITILPKPTAPNGYKLTGFTYKGKFYGLNDVWNVEDYDGSRLIAEYEDDSSDWSPIVSKPTN